MNNNNFIGGQSSDFDLGMNGGLLAKFLKDGPIGDRCAGETEVAFLLHLKYGLDIGQLKALMMRHSVIMQAGIKANASAGAVAREIEKAEGIRKVQFENDSSAR